MRIVLLSTYDLGRQPFGLASPAAWLRERGHEVTCADLSQQALPREAVAAAQMLAIHLPMHTATRKAIPVIAEIRKLNAGAKLCCYGLYAPLNAEFLQSLGVDALIGGEFEEALVRFAEGQPQGETITLDRLAFRVPDRQGLTPLDLYPRLQTQSGRKLVAYTEASRGCKHLCRHCPVVNVYRGQFRVVPAEIVQADIRQQIAAGATHVTFGDPDFFNGPGHALRIMQALHAEFPEVTYDATIKVEHLLQRRDLLPRLRQTGCVLITSAVESLDDAVLAKLEKGHTRADFLQACELVQREGLALSPTFIPFTPWTTVESYRDLLRTLFELGFAGQVNSVQLALRLLIPAGSRLLELDEINAVVAGYDDAALLWRWRHKDAGVDALAADLLRLVDRAQKKGIDREAIFRAIAERAGVVLPAADVSLMPRTTVPYLEEPWYC